MAYNNSFKIIVPSYNAKKWISKCLQSIQNQKFKNYSVLIVDDFSNDGKEISQEIIIDYCERNKWGYLFNTDRKFALQNIYNGIGLLQPNDQDVIITVDGDDWLYDENVLSKLHEYYTKEDIHITYGQYTDSRNLNWNSRELCQQPTDKVIANKLYRSLPWAFSHLKSFKYGLFKRIVPSHLKNVNGKMFETASDLAIMFPMMEMAGTKFKCINDILYVYNMENPISDFRVAKEDQAKTDGIIRRMPKYPTISL